MNDIHFSSKSNEWSTPQDFFDLLNDEFHFTLDAAASAKNAKCELYLTQEDDALNCRWGSKSRVFLNPPYGREIGKWIEKAATEPTELTVMLIPARTDTKAWHQWIFGKAEVRFVPGRLKFGGGYCKCSVSKCNCDIPAKRKDSPFPVAVVIFKS